MGEFDVLEKREVGAVHRGDEQRLESIGDSRQRGMNHHRTEALGYARTVSTCAMLCQLTAVETLVPPNLSTSHASALSGKEEDM